MPRTTARGTRRTTARWVHIVAALALGAFVYAPAPYVEPLRLALQLAIIPAATLTGVYLWKQAWIHRLLRGRAGAAAR